MKLGRLVIYCHIHHTFLLLKFCATYTLYVYVYVCCVCVYVNEGQSV